MNSRIVMRAGLTALALLAVAAPTPRPAFAGQVVGVDVGNYILMYQGGSSGSQLSINNFGTTGIWNGDIGIAGSGMLAATGPGTLVGNINFAASNTGQASISNTTINGSVNYSVAGVQTVMNNLNSLSSTLGGLAGAGTSVAINTSSDQTIVASNGTAETINGVNYNLFNVTSFSSGNGQNLIIQGNGSASVVFDINFNTQFHGNILLEDLSGKFYGQAGYSGLTPDQVLFNLYGGNGTTFSGGPTMDISNNGNAAHPNNITLADFLDPNGTVSADNSRIIGRIFGGDSHNMQIVSGDTITVPPSAGPPPVPEPSTMALVVSGVAAVALTRLRGRARRAPRS